MKTTAAQRRASLAGAKARMAAFERREREARRIPAISLFPTTGFSGMPAEQARAGTERRPKEFDAAYEAAYAALEAPRVSAQARMLEMCGVGS